MKCAYHLVSSQEPDQAYSGERGFLRMWRFWAIGTAGLIFLHTSQLYVFILNFQPVCCVNRISLEFELAFLITGETEFLL